MEPSIITHKLCGGSLTNLVFPAINLAARKYAEAMCRLTIVGDFEEAPVNFIVGKIEALSDEGGKEGYISMLKNETVEPLDFCRQCTQMLFDVGAVEVCCCDDAKLLVRDTETGLIKVRKDAWWITSLDRNGVHDVMHIVYEGLEIIDTLEWGHDPYSYSEMLDFMKRGLYAATFNKEQLN